MSQQGIVLDGPLGRVEVTASALASLVARSAEAVANVRVRRSRRRPAITVEPGRVCIELDVEAASGALMLEVGEAVQRSVAGAVTRSTGLPARVDVVFEGIR
jgi:uncharacterized alkaline shock family protein YloU